ncbi:MAG: hypothetical protein WAK84_00250, partial [Candidatus Cybelea sp.]
MKRCLAIFFAALWLVVLGPATSATASESDAALRTALQQDLNAHLAARSKIERISTISLSVSLHGQPQNINVTAGTTKFGGGVP